MMTAIFTSLITTLLAYVVLEFTAKPVSRLKGPKFLHTEVVASLQPNWRARLKVVGGFPPMRGIALAEQSKSSGSAREA